MDPNKAYEFATGLTDGDTEEFNRLMDEFRELDMEEKEQIVCTLVGLCKAKF